MKLTKVAVRWFKRFNAAEFDLQGGSVVLAGPNNAGKTTLLQAIATWHVTLDRWLEMGNKNPGNGYVKAPMARQALLSVPLLNFGALWPGGSGLHRAPLEIELCFDGRSPLAMEIAYDTTEQVYVRPAHRDNIYHSRVFDNKPSVVFIPAMGGIDTEEPVYQLPKIQEMLGRGKPGDVLRNLLADVHQNTDKWEVLCAEVKSIFGYEMLPPNTAGAHIRAEYRHNGATLDVSAAGSGFLQVLMLLSFLCAHKNAILLFDEPDAHLHILLQDRIFETLGRFARESDSTLIMATHSEGIINAANPRQLCVLGGGQPQTIADGGERAALIRSLGVLDNADIMNAQSEPGVLYVEGHTDISILRAWAEVLQHRLLGFLQSPFWKPTVYETRHQGKGIKSKEHFEALQLTQDNARGFELRDGDGAEHTPRITTQDSLARGFWRRYEIESYLIHPDALVRFAQTASGGQEEAAEKMREYLANNLPPAIFNNPLDNHDYLVKGRGKEIISRALQEAGLEGEDDYSQIAAKMLPEEIHPDVAEMLNSIADHFGIGEQ